jgi:hypothetical protein
MVSAQAAHCATARTSRTLVARHRRLIEVRTARALKQIARSGRLVAQLCRCAGQKGARQDSIVTAHGRIRSEVGVAHESTDPHAASRRRLDRVETKPVDVHKVGRRLDLQFHQVEKVGAAGDEFGARLCSDSLDGIFRTRRPFVGKIFHAGTPATSQMAATMFG